MVDGIEVIAFEEFVDFEGDCRGKTAIFGFHLVQKTNDSFNF